MNRIAFAAAFLACVSLGTPRNATSQDATPPHRRHHALTYDPVAGTVLLFGGQHLVSESEAPVLDDIWSWNGSRWTQLARGSGLTMIAHKLFVDQRGVLHTTANRLGLTAKWAEQRWTTVVTDTAVRREIAAGAWDTRRQRFVLFGGHVDGRAFPVGTWEFDGMRWREFAVAGPPAMLGGSMTYDARRGVMVLFGGLTPQGAKLGGSWEWNGATWARVATTGPSPRFGAGIAFDSARGEVVLFGGVDSTNQKLNDTWLWNGTSWRLAGVNAAPSPRSEGYLAYDARRRVVVLFGGEGEATIPTLGDTWEWDGTQWRRAG